MRCNNFFRIVSIFTANRLASNTNRCICRRTSQNEIGYKTRHTLLFLTGLKHNFFQITKVASQRAFIHFM